MKKISLLILLTVAMLGCRKEEIIETDNRSDSEILVLNFTDNDVIKGRMRIKLKEEPAGSIAVRSVNGQTSTGIKALDASASTIRITHMERTFPPAGQFEERTRKEGLHLWYDIWYSEEVAATRAVSQVSVLDGIEIAAPIMKVVSTACPPQPGFVNTVTRNSDTSFNDPTLSQQWGFINQGTSSWQKAGADIRLSEVWAQYNGNPNVIVAIVDGGIDVNHPDLKANLWINPKEIPNNGKDDDNNGYVDDINGYNFVSQSATITPHRHGTHVAGTVAAVNNNGIGVCGIAGGNGLANSGVKLMSCQMLEHPQNSYYTDKIANNTSATIKYGADNGAVISQNSWGYSHAADDYIDPADKAAIDYFVKYAGCDNNGNQLPNSPMKGGVVLFAAGNTSSSSPGMAAPANYEKVLGVAAIGADYKKPGYSNFGEYIDICAPGGIENGEKGIYSTTIAQFGYYEYRYGTSMACPHVSGTAALVIEKHGVGKQGFTARQLEEILLTSAYSLDEYNPQYIGKLGSGCVDASKALNAQITDNQPFALITNPVTDNQLAFRVDMELAGKAEVRIYNSMGNKVLQKSIVTQRFVATTIDINRLATGYYSLEYQCNGNKQKANFIKY